jgi:hypothetical protein
MVDGVHLPGRAASRPHRCTLRDRRADHGESFLAYVELVLVPTLASGDIVIIDNPGSHKGKAVRQR